MLCADAMRREDGKGNQGIDRTEPCRVLYFVNEKKSMLLGGVAAAYTKVSARCCREMGVVVEVEVGAQEATP
jgi:hypothetical protein